MGKYEDLINVLLHIDRSLAYRQGPMSRGNYVDEWLVRIGRTYEVCAIGLRLQEVSVFLPRIFCGEGLFIYHYFFCEAGCRQFIVGAVSYRSIYSSLHD